MRLVAATTTRGRRSILVSSAHKHGRCRLLSGKVGEQTYIDKWFASIVKSPTFYESHAESNPRRYYYNVDLQGRLFLEETLPKNIATSIKDERFLDFFFRQVRPIGPREQELMVSMDISTEEYPFVSPCGKELNFIRPAATPIVFHTYNQSGNLIYAGSKSQPFQPSELAVSQVTGRLYHQCTHMDKAVAQLGNSETRQFALIRSAVVVALSDRIGPALDDEEEDELMSGLAYFPDEGEPQPIPWLPPTAEPGTWAMPFSEDAPDG